MEGASRGSKGQVMLGPEASFQLLFSLVHPYFISGLFLYYHHVIFLILF